MSNRALLFVETAIPFLSLASNTLKRLDDDDEGLDDQSAAGVSYGAAVLTAITENTPIPLPPQALVDLSQIRTDRAVPNSQIRTDRAVPNSRALLFVETAIPFLKLAGNTLKRLDPDDQGVDDRSAAGVDYVANLLMAITSGSPIPLPPQGVVDLTPVQSPTQ